MFVVVSSIWGRRLIYFVGPYTSKTDAERAIEDARTISHDVEVPPYHYGRHSVQVVQVVDRLSAVKLGMEKQNTLVRMPLSAADLG